MGVNRGGRAPRIWIRGTLMQIVSTFCHISKFQTPDCLHYNAVMQQEAYQSHIILTAYSLFPKITSSTFTKLPLQAENLTFFWQGHRQKVRHRMQQNTPFLVKNSFFLGLLPRPFPQWAGVSSPHPTLVPTKPSGSTLRPPEYRIYDIYATASNVVHCHHYSSTNANGNAIKPCDDVM